MAKARLAADIGGTFTDIAIEKSSGERVTAKTLTTHGNPAEGVLTGISDVLDKAALTPADIGVIIHGTTLATNALIERRGARTALLTTEGHRDALEMAYENRFEQYDINIDRPVPLVPRWLRLPIRERMNKDGEVLIPLSRDSVEAVLPVLEQEQVESIAIGYLHAFANDRHEVETAEYLAQQRPDLSITLASEVAPEIREYERISTAVANAYVRPLMEKYLLRLQKDLEKSGFACPFLLMSSGAGLMGLETAAKFPIRLVESGPAGGAVLASVLAEECDLPSLLSFDMGGTTAKICLIDNFTAQTSRTFEVDRSYRFKKGSGLPVRIPVIEMVEIGAGGGSIASIDKLKRIQIGPESAGSDPGPVAYGQGGTAPTVTDADVALGKILPDRFAGGRMKLDVRAGSRAISETIGSPLAMTGDDAAFALNELVDENMANAARAHAVEGGHDISARAMVAFGGAAPLHAARLAEKLGIDKILIPVDAGVGSAIGFLLAPVAFEVVRSRYMLLSDFDPSVVSGLVEEMRVEAEAVVLPALGEESVTETAEAYMRYAGQGYEIPVPINTECMDVAQLHHAYEEKYRTMFGRSIPRMPVEILSFTLTLSGPKKIVCKQEVSAIDDVVKAATTESVFDPKAMKRLDYGVVDRADLSPGSRIPGPALIVEDQTTIVVTSAFDATVGSAGHIMLTRKDADE